MPDDIITTITPDGVRGRIAFEGAADPTLIMETIRGTKTTLHWVVQNMIGTQEFPEFGPYILVIDFLQGEWEAYRLWPGGSIRRETYCKGAITKWDHLTGLVAMITDHMAERRLEALCHIQEACRG